MSTRPKPWELANAPPPTSSYFAPGSGLSISPTFQTNGSYFSGSTAEGYGNPPSVHENVSYNPSPQLQTQTHNWATSGPTISPDLGALDAINLGTDSDPNFPMDPLTAHPHGTIYNQREPGTATNHPAYASSSSALSSGYQPLAAEGIYDPLDLGGSSFDNDLDMDTFNDYLDFEFGQNGVPPKQTEVRGDGIMMGDEGLPSPGVIGTSSSTPAPASTLRPNPPGQDHTPTSSHSL